MQKVHCHKMFNISNTREAALSSHAKGAKHQSAAAAPNPITGLFTRVTDVTPAPSCGASLSATVEQDHSECCVQKRNSNCRGTVGAKGG